jgi:hypothetical protein
MLKGGGGFNVNAELQERTSDNLAAPYEVKLLSSSMALTGEMLAVQCGTAADHHAGSVDTGHGANGKDRYHARLDLERGVDLRPRHLGAEDDRQVLHRRPL